MIVLLVVSFLRFSLATEPNETSQLQCYSIVSCENTFQYFVRQDYYFSSNLRNHEKNIGSSGHWEGFKPTQYDLFLAFGPEEDYAGSVDIAGAIVQETSSLATNVDRNYIQFSARNILITCCSSLPQRDICIQNATHHVGLDYTLFSMNETLRLGDQCVIRFPRFRSNARRDTPDTPAIGLRISEGNGTVVVHTNFRMRYARTVFPCLDHPALKARFNFRVEYPESFRPFSSTPLRNDGFIVKSEHCHSSSFELTAPIPTYMFGFALVKGYTVLIRSPPPVKLYVPRYLKPTLQWIPSALQDVVNNPKLPQINSYQITCIVLSSMPATSISSYGLIFVNSISIRLSLNDDAKKVMLYEAILRQYFGAMVTVTDWNDICLPEGLLQYFAFVLKESLFKAQGQELTTEALSTVCAKHRGSLTGNENEAMWKTYKCDERAGVFFQSLSNTFESDVVGNLLNELVANYGNSTAGLKAWDEALVRAVSASSALGRVVACGSSLSGYVEHYFRQHAPTLLFVKLVNANPFYLNISVGGNVSSNLPIPLSYFVPGHLGNSTLILARNHQTIGLSDSNPWVFVDPDGATCTTKVYNDVGYVALLNPNRSDFHSHINEKRMTDFLRDFCYAVMHNLVTHSRHILSSEWQQALQFAYMRRPSCRCCLVHRDVVADCSKDELAECDDVTISKLL